MLPHLLETINKLFGHAFEGKIKSETKEIIPIKEKLLNLFKTFIFKEKLCQNPFKLLLLKF